MHPDQFRNVVALPPLERYWYFVRVVADKGEVWGLRTPEGRWVAVETSWGTAYPFWPEKEFAAAAAAGEWASASPTSIPLERFLDRWLQGMARGGDRVGVFWHPEDLVGIDVEPEVLSVDLVTEGAQYE
ncbi:MAG: DUF2750 domain-containing protein [Chloroflexota bacterium]